MDENEDEDYVYFYTDRRSYRQLRVTAKTWKQVKKEAKKAKVPDDAVIQYGDCGSHEAFLYWYEDLDNEMLDFGRQY